MKYVVAAVLGGALFGWGLRGMLDPPRRASAPTAVFYSGNVRCLAYPKGYVNCEDGRVYRQVPE